MAIETIESRMNVVEAAKRRITNVFSNGVRVYMSFSAGKDSLCMSHLVYEKIVNGEIDPKLLTVIFINEGTRRVADRYRRFYVKSHDFMRPRDFKQMYEAMIAGDPKLRTLRALYVTVYSAYAKYARESAARREVNTDV